MGNEISVKTTTSIRGNKVFTLEKKDANGQPCKMTITIFDRNSDGQMNPADGIKFDGDFNNFKANDIAAASASIFADYTEEGEMPERLKDSANIGLSLDGKSGKVTNIDLTSGSDSPTKAMNLGKFKEALDKLDGSQGGQQAPAAGGQAPAGGGNVTMPENFFQMSIPDIRGLSNIMEESGFRGCMLMPDLSATPYTMCADLDRALDAVFKPFMMNVKGLMERSSGGYVPNSTPSGQTSGSGSTSSADTAADKKAKEDAEAARKAEEEQEKAKKELVDAAKKKREEEVADILKDLFDSMKMCGTDEEALKTAIGRIKKENVLEVLETWEKSDYAEKMGSKSLIEVIDGETNGIIWSDADEYLKPIAEKLRERSNSKDANLLAGAINSEFETKDVTKLYELVRKESNDTVKPLADPLEVRIEAKFDAALKKKTDNEKNLTQAQADAKKAKADADKNNSTVASLQKQIDTINAKKKPTKADKEALKKAQEELGNAQLAQAKANEKAEEAKEKVESATKKAKASEKITIKTEDTKAANEKTKDPEAGKTKKDEAKKDEAEGPGFWAGVKELFRGKPAPKLTRDHMAPPVVIKEAPKAEPTQAQSPADAATANPEKDKKLAEYKETMAKFNKSRENQGQHPEETAALQKELEKLDKQLLDLHVSRADIDAIK